MLCILALLLMSGCARENKKYEISPSNEAGAINEAIKGLISSQDYINGDEGKRADLLKSLFDDVADNGVEQFPYSLVFKDSIICHDNKVRVRYRRPDLYYVFIVTGNHIYQVYYDDPEAWEDEGSKYTLSYIYTSNDW